ncbi:hypothetical protein P1X14_02580 [Sphingomonas sp. AOB5]|uniref:hypothetical protein n=1 Tax=Sphingomonas sp. AOB5 TaxID=3034017 RepID=UPI0023F97E22|nr:hypothetical protein [Sphingomonas sp. AOB5]MDF7774121.1 hypothetical protein [Sphingomonas sp. AOB5]
MSDALERRKTLDPDIEIGPLAIWVGSGKGHSWPWIDLAIRVGTGYEKLLDANGPMVKRPDLIAFFRAFRDFVRKLRHDVVLSSSGSSMRLTLQRSDEGSLRGELWFERWRVNQTLSFALWDGAFEHAIAQVDAVHARLLDAERSWVPQPARLDIRDSAIPDEVQPARKWEPWDSGLGDGQPVRLRYEIDGYGWYGITVWVGEKQGEFGGGYMTDPMGDLLRCALLLVAGQRKAEMFCNAEPDLTFVEFEEIVVRMDVDAAGDPVHHHGCAIRIRPDDHRGEPMDPEFEGVATSPRAVAEAIYLMALEHFRDGAGPWSRPMAALEGALATVPR